MYKQQCLERFWAEKRSQKHEIVFMDRTGGALSTGGYERLDQTTKCYIFIDEVFAITVSVPTQ